MWSFRLLYHQGDSLRGNYTIQKNASFARWVHKKCLVIIRFRMEKKCFSYALISSFLEGFFIQDLLYWPCSTSHLLCYVFIGKSAFSKHGDGMAVNSFLFSSYDLSLRLCFVHSCFDTLRDDLFLKLSECSDNGKHQLPCWRTGINMLLMRDKVYSELLEGIERIDQMCCGAWHPIEPPY